MIQLAVNPIRIPIKTTKDYVVFGQSSKSKVWPGKRYLGCILDDQDSVAIGKADWFFQLIQSKHSAYTSYENSFLSLYMLNT
jgi:hypothetical protein